MEEKRITYIAIAVAFVFLSLVLGKYALPRVFLIDSYENVVNSVSMELNKNQIQKQNTFKVLNELVTITELKIGTGDEAVDSSMVTLHYILKIIDEDNTSKIIDQSSPNNPFTFELDSGAVIEGFNAGVKGMRVGGKRNININSKAGYGSNGIPGSIPPHTDLIFELELLAVK